MNSSSQWFNIVNSQYSCQAFGGKLVKLELTNCTNFQSGTALNIRKYCGSLRYLKLEIDSTDGNSNAGIQEALQEQNIHTLENQVCIYYIHMAVVVVVIFIY